ncbi:MAG: hypothetical protein KKD77_22910 [Gammaproteobacteria bacterium]|nr:hypothetical protein [Gammaproteobacteria bacterium]
MRKLLILTVLLLALCHTAYAKTTYSVLTFVTPNDVTIPHLEDFRTTVVDALNSYDGGNIQSNTITPDQMDANASTVSRWNEAFNDWVYTGLLPATSASLTTSATVGIAYIDGNRVQKDATAHSYTASKWTFVDMNYLGEYTYIEQAIGTSDPAIPANSIRLARVSTDPTTVLAIKDYRIMSISLDSNQSDFWRSGLAITVVTPDQISISPGIVYHGTNRIVKPAATALDLTAAGDWATGATGRTPSTMGFVGVDAMGNIKLFANVPTTHNTAGETAGKLRYSYFNTTYWRLLAWYYMNSSQNIDWYNYGNFKDGDTWNTAMISGDTDISTTSATPVDMADTTMKFYSSGNPIICSLSAPLYFGNVPTVWINIDGANDVKGTILEGGTQTGYVTTEYLSRVAQGTHTIKVQWYVTGTANQRGMTDAPRYLTIQEI